MGVLVHRRPDGSYGKCTASVKDCPYGAANGGAGVPHYEFADGHALAVYNTALDDEEKYGARLGGLKSRIEHGERVTDDDYERATEESREWEQRGVTPTNRGMLNPIESAKYGSFIAGNGTPRDVQDMLRTGGFTKPSDVQSAWDRMRDDKSEEAQDAREALIDRAESIRDYNPNKWDSPQVTPSQRRLAELNAHAWERVRDNIRHDVELGDNDLDAERMNIARVAERTRRSREKAKRSGAPAFDGAPLDGKRPLRKSAAPVPPAPSAPRSSRPPVPPAPPARPDRVPASYTAKEPTAEEMSDWVIMPGEQYAKQNADIERAYRQTAEGLGDLPLIPEPPTAHREDRPVPTAPRSAVPPVPPAPPARPRREPASYPPYPSREPTAEEMTDWVIMPGEQYAKQNADIERAYRQTAEGLGDLPLIPEPPRRPQGGDGPKPTGRRESWSEYGRRASNRGELRERQEAERTAGVERSLRERGYSIDSNARSLIRGLVRNESTRNLGVTDPPTVEDHMLAQGYTPAGRGGIGAMFARLAARRKLAKADREHYDYMTRNR